MSRDLSTTPFPSITRRGFLALTGVGAVCLLAMQTPELAYAAEMLIDGSTVYTWGDPNLEARHCTRMWTGAGVGPVFCMNHHMDSPVPGDTFSGGESYGDVHLDYVMYHGWHGNNAVRGYSGEKASFITVYAVWTVMDRSPEWIDDYMGICGDAGMLDVARALYNEAMAYGGGNSDIDGCARIWHPLITPGWDKNEVQPLVSYQENPRTGEADALKKAVSPSWL